MIRCFHTLGLYGNLKTVSVVFLLTITVCTPATAQTAANAETAASLFKANCAVCHAEDGSGTTFGHRLKVKDLCTKEVQEKSITELAQTVKAGKDNMPAFGDRLNSEQIQKLIEYIRHSIRPPKQPDSDR
jgi:cytochrome c6